MKVSSCKNVFKQAGARKAFALPRPGRTSMPRGRARTGRTAAARNTGQSAVAGVLNISLPNDAGCASAGNAEADDSLTLSLLMALVLGADDHYFAVSFDNFALVAHGLY